MNRRQFTLGTISAAALLATPTVVLAQDGTSGSTPVANNENPFVTGTAFDLVPQGTTDGVEIVAQGPLTSYIVPVVVRNNSSETVTITNIIGTARSSDGTLLDSVTMADIVPKFVEPNGVAFGSAYFSEDLPVNTLIELEPEFESAGSGFITYADLDIVEVEQTSMGFVGTIENTTEENVEFVSVVGVTFTNDGTPIGVYNGHLSNSVVLPGDTGTFDGYTSGTGSELFLIAAYATIF